jgi:hypothetical protein
MANDEMEALKARVAELESLLGAQRREPEFTADEMAAFHKVSAVLAGNWGDFCGINDCYRPPVVRCVNFCITRCITVCIVRCINECSCGPCNVGGGIPGGISRFDQFGG